MHGRGERLAQWRASGGRNRAQAMLGAILRRRRFGMSGHMTAHLKELL